MRCICAIGKASSGGGGMDGSLLEHFPSVPEALGSNPVLKKIFFCSLGVMCTPGVQMLGVGISFGLLSSSEEKCWGLQEAELRGSLEYSPQKRLN